MIILQGHATTPDELEVVTSVAADIDVHVATVDSSDAAPPVPENPEPNGVLITTATTTVVATAPTSASKVRGIKTLMIRNRDTTDTTQVTVQIDFNSAGANVIQLHSASLAPGEALVYEDNLGWYEIAASASDTGSVDIASANTAQIASHSADTYYIGMNTDDALGSRLQAGCFFRWEFFVTKGAAGVAAPVVSVRFGTAGTTGDTARAVCNLSAQTAAADSGHVRVVAIFRSVGGGSSAVIQMNTYLEHQLATTGLNSTTTGSQLVQNTGAGFDSTPAGSKVGLSVNPGTSGAWVVEGVTVEAQNLKR